MKKVLLITNIPNPYRIPLFNELSLQLKQHDWELTVVFGAKGYSRRKFEISENEMKFRYHFLDSEGYQIGDSNEKTTFSYKGLISCIRKEKPDLIISNGFSPATLLVWLNRITGGARFLIWSGAIAAPGRFDSFLRRMQRKLMIVGASGFVAYGTAAASYLKQSGSGNKPVHIAINTVDTTFFRDETNARRLTPNSSGLKHLTFTGYLVKRKGVDKLLECIKVVAASRNDFILDILGDGEDRKRLEQWCIANGIADRVRFHGFIQKNELPAYLALSDVFLFQTDFDIWGLVLNEAMAAGLPVIASPNAGATFDLIKDGETGYISDFSEVIPTAKLISHLMDHSEEARKTGAKAAEYIKEHADVSCSARGFLDAILKAGT